MNDFEAFSRLLEALRPWLPDLVVVGGWAYHLYWYHPFANRSSSFLPLRTRDADIAFSLAEMHGDIATALAAAKFKHEVKSEHIPPVSHYRLSEDKAGFFAEFLAPLKGSREKRGKLDATVRNAGIIAQKLRYMDLLLVKPFDVTLGSTIGFPLDPPAVVPLANPVSFIAQKLLIHQERSSEKRSKDVLYIHDTVLLFASHLDDLREIWREGVRPSLPLRTAGRVERLARERFSEVDDIIRTAARLPQDRTLRPERVSAVCAAGLEEIFGTGDS